MVLSLTTRRFNVGYSTKTDTVCLTELLTNVQADNGTFTLDFAQQWVPAEYTAIVSNKDVSGVSQHAFCTDCNQRWYNIIRTAVPNSADYYRDSQMAIKCGTSFVGGCHSVWACGVFADEGIRVW